MKLKFVFSSLCLIVAAGQTVISAQTQKNVITNFSFPAEAKEINGFVTAGWTLDEDSRVTGDLNGDSIPDEAFILMQDNPASPGARSESDAQRQVLIVVFGSKDGILRRAAVSPGLLPCVHCYGQIGEGGLFYEKGTLLVEQSSGRSGNTFAKASYRFRYDPAAKKFWLTGTEFLNSCPVRRMHADNSESTNFITGIRTTSLLTGKRTVTRKTSVPKTKIDLEAIDHERQEEAAFKRIQCR